MATISPCSRCCDHPIAPGEAIEEYPTDDPFPSPLILGWRGARPLHVVAADNSLSDETIIITVYEPRPNQWDATFRKRTNR